MSDHVTRKPAQCLHCEYPFGPCLLECQRCECAWCVHDRADAITVAARAAQQHGADGSMSHTVSDGGQPSLRYVLKGGDPWQQ